MRAGPSSPWWGRPTSRPCELVYIDGEPLGDQKARAPGRSLATLTRSMGTVSARLWYPRRADGSLCFRLAVAKRLGERNTPLPKTTTLEVDVGNDDVKCRARTGYHRRRAANSSATWTTRRARATRRWRASACSSEWTVTAAHLRSDAMQGASPGPPARGTSCSRWKRGSVTGAPKFGSGGRRDVSASAGCPPGDRGSLRRSPASGSVEAEIGPPVREASGRARTTIRRSRRDAASARETPPDRHEQPRPRARAPRGAAVAEGRPGGAVPDRGRSRCPGAGLDPARRRSRQPAVR